MQSIERIEEIRLSRVDDQNIADLLAEAFAENFGSRSYYQNRHHIRLVQRSGSRIVGHIALCFRDVRLGRTLVPIVGLAEVATAPDFQGQGIATRLLQATFDEARQSSAQFILLFGDRPIYAGNGFASYRNPVTYLELDGAITRGVKFSRDHDLMVFPLTEKPWDSNAALDILGHKF